MSRPRPARPRLLRRAAIVQILSLAVAVIVGLFILAAKVNAADKGDAKDEKSKPGSGMPIQRGDAGKPDAGDKPAAALSSASADAGVRDGGKPIDYAVLPGEGDLDAHLSEEQKASIGEGKVPIHREGKFRSPFAHPRFGGPATAKVGLVINNVREYDIQHGSFDADFFLSLTSDKPMGAVELFFTNGHEVTQTVLADTPTFKAYRFTGSFISRVDLRRYPFDTQYLSIEVEDLRAGIDQLIFEPYQERTSLDAQFVLAGWGVESIAARTYKHLYPPRFDRDDLYVSRYKFSLGIERFATSAAFSVFFPAYIIVLISLMGLWVRAERLDIRTNAVAPMLAAAVFFHYSLTQSLPAVGYLTRADKLMLGVYVALLINMLSTWSFLIIGEKQVETVFRWARALVPPVTIVLMLAVSWI